MAIIGRLRRRHIPGKQYIMHGDTAVPNEFPFYVQGNGCGGGTLSFAVQGGLEVLRWTGFHLLRYHILSSSPLPILICVLESTRLV